MNEPKDNNPSSYEISIDLEYSSLKNTLILLIEMTEKSTEEHLLGEQRFLFLKEVINSLMNLPNSVNIVKIFHSLYRVIIRTP